MCGENKKYFVLIILSWKHGRLSDNVKKYVTARYEKHNMVHRCVLRDVYIRQETHIRVI